jgi:hypothetical protein
MLYRAKKNRLAKYVCGLPNMNLLNNYGLAERKTICVPELVIGCNCMYCTVRICTSAGYERYIDARF